jgi:hypothetical protein
MSQNSEFFNNFSGAIAKISGQFTEATVTTMLVETMARATAKTPVATSNLVNSQYYKTNRVGTSGWAGVAGYTAAYAADVHEASGSLKGLGIKRSTVEGEDYGNFWDGANGPNSGEPKFLKKGIAEMVQNDFKTIVRSNYKL